MNLLRRMARRKSEDERMEILLRIPKKDPQLDTTSGRSYTPADIEALEEERVPWLKARRRRR